MAITKPRNRTVLFRLTQEEYELLQNACSANDARSLSDYARDRILKDSTPPASISQMESKLDELRQTVDRIARILEPSTYRSGEQAAA
ncbi:MAG: hypothetical protein ABI824_18935 [Acidobacteriota bacterium]